MAKLLFDIGGTKTRLALSSAPGKLDTVKTIPTSQHFGTAMKEFAQAAQELSRGVNIDNAVGGVAAMFDKDMTLVFKSPNLKGWEGKPIKKELEKALGVTVTIENDAALAGLGEAVYGAGKGFNNVVYITVSTGVGGSRIINQKIDNKVYSFEPGQQILSTDSNLSLEKLISGAAVENKYSKKAFEIAPDDALWEGLANILAVGLYNSCIHWSPEAIVLGGSMILGNPAIPLAPVESKLRNLLDFYPTIPAMKKAELGDESGLMGASIYDGR